MSDGMQADCEHGNDKQDCLNCIEKRLLKIRESMQKKEKSASELEDEENARRYEKHSYLINCASGHRILECLEACEGWASPILQRSEVNAEAERMQKHMAKLQRIIDCCTDVLMNINADEPATDSDLGGAALALELALNDESYRTKEEVYKALDTGES